jgi:tetratricopeptide (TPR) repeat protein
VDRAGSRRALLASAWLLATVGVGCVTLPPRSRAPGPQASVLDHAPVRSFADDQCGPGSLSVVLETLGDAVSEAELAASLPRAPGGGVLSVDLLLAARQRGFEAALLTGDADAVQREIQAGRPVILMLRMLNVPGRRGDIYHYVVVDGHDPGRSLLRIQFGDGNARWVSPAQLEGAWAGGGHAMLTVSAPPTLASMRAAVEQERAGRLDEAARLYAAVLEANPQSQRAWSNLGNVEAGRGRRQEAERAYRRALSISPDDPDALNNLAWLLLQEGSRLEEAEGLAREASRRPGSERALILDTLARIQSTRGRCSDAEATWAEALALPALPLRQRAQLEEARRDAGRSCPPK